MTKEEFLKQLKSHGLNLNTKQIKQLDTYASFLKEYNEKINLTAIVEYEEVLDKHFYDSLLGFFDLNMEGTLVDVGTGAGFPGVVLKICYPELKVILVEPIKTYIKNNKNYEKYISVGKNRQCIQLNNYNYLLRN